MRKLMWVVLLVGCVSLTPGGEAVPQGSEFQVNSFTTSFQFQPSVSSDDAGNFVVVWGSRDQDGSFEGVFGQRYDSSGVALGSEFQVNSFTTSSQVFPSVSSDDAGNFVVAWSSRNQDGSFSFGVFGQRYDSSGVALGSEFQVNSFTMSYQGSPSVSSDDAGNFVVVWYSSGQDGSSYGVFGQRYDSSGVALGSEFQVNSFTTSSQIFPSVSSDDAGNFVVVWRSVNQDGSSFGVFGQRYDSSGVALGSEFQVNSFTESSQRYPSVSSDGAGNFVVAWQSSGQDGSGDGVFGQRYDSSGVALGSEFQVNSFTTSSQSGPSVSSDGAGNFVVAWESYGQDGSGYGVFGQRYDSDGVALGSEFQVNSFTTGTQGFRGPSVSSDGAGNFVVAWTSDGGQDGSSFGVFGQRYAVPCPDADMDGYADCTVAGCDASGLLCGDCDDTDMDIRPGVADPCDDVDNNCNGEIDEDFMSMPTATTCGVGACVTNGATMCIAGVVEDVCTPLPPSPEICDNAIDDDCDTFTDSFDSDCPLTAFVTSTTSDGDLGGVGGADQQCTALAAQAGLPSGLYKAWLSDGAGGPATSFDTNGGAYVLPNGTEIATDFADLTDGTLLAPVDVTEQGVALPASGQSRVWTGTRADGTPLNTRCSDWTLNSSFDRGGQARWDRTDTSWSFSGASPCNNKRRLYCFQQPGATPPPSPRIIFLSSTQSNGNLGGLAGADATCNALAGSASLPGTYQAWLSDDTESPNSRFSMDATGYFRVDGTLVAASYADLSDGSLLAPITVTESGAEITGTAARAWTGTNAMGDGLPAMCEAWTTGSSGPRGANGQPQSTSSTWSFGGAAGCNQQRRLYCVQQAETAPAGESVRPERESGRPERERESPREARRR